VKKRLADLEKHGDTELWSGGVEEEEDK